MMLSTEQCPGTPAPTLTLLQALAVPLLDLAFHLLEIAVLLQEFSQLITLGMSKKRSAIIN